MSKHSNINSSRCSSLAAPYVVVIDEASLSNCLSFVRVFSIHRLFTGIVVWVYSLSTVFVLMRY